MLIIDGAAGEGGGQVVRSSLALSLVTRQPFTITNIRARRKRPGLLQQHLTAVHAAAKISAAQVDGAGLAASSFAFSPDRITPGEYHFSIGTAGSATLVLQTLLPALLVAEGPSRITLEGGTHNPWAPPFDFLAKAYLPLIERMGPHLTMKLDAYGFYPAGGGRLIVSIQPAVTLTGFDLLQRGDIVTRWVHALVARLPLHIAQRECNTIAKATGWEDSCFRSEEASPSRGPGNVVLIGLECQHVIEVFVGFGKRGVKAERVATEAVTALQAYLASNVPVGPYLADQLIVPLGVSAQLGGGGGSFLTMPLTRHATTQLDLLDHFLDAQVQVEQEDAEQFTVKIGPK